jgi:hypothetical protein
MSTKLLPISDDAKALLGTVFAFGATTLSFQMKESRPTARVSAALKELVHHEAVIPSSINQAGGVEYRIRIDTDPYRKWVACNKSKAAFELVEPIRAKAGEG